MKFLQMPKIIRFWEGVSNNQYRVSHCPRINKTYDLFVIIDDSMWKWGEEIEGWGCVYGGGVSWNFD
jgi:hypothetical protein